MFLLEKKYSKLLEKDHLMKVEGELVSFFTFFYHFGICKTMTLENSQLLRKKFPLNMHMVKKLNGQN